MRIYEGMFVLDDARSNENWDAVSREIRGILEKNQAEIYSCERWDERRLAYPIKGRNRAVYLLARFTAPPGVLQTIERDCQLSDTVLRVLLVRDIQNERLDKAGQFLPKEGEEPAEAGAAPEAAPEAAPDAAPDAAPEAAQAAAEPASGQEPPDGDQPTQP